MAEKPLPPEPDTNGAGQGQPTIAEEEDTLALIHATDFMAPAERWQESLGADSPHERRSHWSVAWADLTMTMFILFLVMYAYQAANRQFLGGDDPDSGFTAVLGAAPIGVVGSEKDEGSSANIYAISQHILEGDLDAVKVDMAVDQSVRIVLTGDLLFDPGQAELKPTAAETMAKVGYIIKQTPYMVNVVGHTDSVPIHSAKFPTNWELSLARASRVARFFIEQRGIPGKRFYVTGHSYYRPLAPNNSVRNREMNRRVEVIITKEMPGGYTLPQVRVNPQLQKIMPVTE